MTLILRLAGWLMIGASPILAVALGAKADAPFAGAAIADSPAALMAVWTVIPVLVSGVMFAAFGELVAHARAIDRAVSAQYVLLESYRRERASAAEVPDGRRRAR